MWQWRLKNKAMATATIAITLGAVTALAAPKPPKPKTQPQKLPQSAIGPASAAEAEILWKEGFADYEAGRYAEAVHRLQRYVDRYPAAPGFAEAQLMIGRSHLQLGQWKEAQAPLLAFISSHTQTIEGHEARLDLARSQLGRKQFNEAYLTSLEVLSAKAPSPIPPKLEIAALLLRSHALIGLGREDRATQTLESARKSIASLQPALQPPGAPGGGANPPPTDPEVEELQMEAESIRMDLKTRTCARYPSARALSEAQTLDQFGRRADCLLEATIIVKDASPVSGNFDVMTENYATAFENYAKAIRNPPIPPRDPQRPRSKRQLEQYKMELADRLSRSMTQKKSQAIELLKPSPKDALPSGRDAQLNTLIRRLEQIR